MEINELFEKKLLRKISRDLEKVKTSLKISASKLEEAKRLFSSEFYGNALLNIYTSMFHASRAILYNEGIQEKSHYGVYVYLKEKFSDKIPKELLNSFNYFREERHEFLYGFEEDPSRKEVEESILDSEEFLEITRRILKDV